MTTAEVSPNIPQLEKLMEEMAHLSETSVDIDLTTPEGIAILRQNLQANASLLLHMNPVELGLAPMLPLYDSETNQTNFLQTAVTDSKQCAWVWTADGNLTEFPASIAAITDAVRIDYDLNGTLTGIFPWNRTKAQELHNHDVFLGMGAGATDMTSDLDFRTINYLYVEYGGLFMFIHEAAEQISQENPGINTAPVAA